MKQKLSIKRVTLKNKILRVIWNISWVLFFRPSPVPFHAWRCLLLSLFGAKVGKGALPYPTAKIWAPWNLTMGEGSCLSHHVDCYCVDKIELGAHSTISQYSFLCTASHDYSQLQNPLPLITAPIIIGKNAWVTADVFIGPGVTVGEGAVIGATSSVFSDVDDWCVVSGNPAKYVKKRIIHIEV